MKIFKVTNTEKFLDRLGKCEGKVYVVAPDGGLRDIKGCAEALRSLRWMGGRLDLPNEFELRFEKSGDALTMLHFMTESNSGAA